LVKEALVNLTKFRFKVVNTRWKTCAIYGSYGLKNTLFSAFLKTRKPQQKLICVFLMLKKWVELFVNNLFFNNICNSKPTN